MKPGALIARKYRLTRQLGSGAMGAVWAAVNEQTSGEVALKFLLHSTDDTRKRLEREARATGRLKHPNIIEIYDMGETEEGDPFLVMPLLQGETLSELLSRKFKLDPAEAARIARDAARALAAAHTGGIVHRDLKPANIFLEQVPDQDMPRVKVLDFGVSKNQAGGESDGLATVTGGVVGSPAYMSPEQARSDKTVDHRADIWSLGVVLFEMLAGQRPFQGEPHQLMIKIATTDAPRLSRVVWNINPALDNLVGSCLERDRNKRISSAAEVAKELDRLVAPGAPGPALGQSSTFAAVQVPISAPRPPMGSRPELPSVVDDDDDEDNAATARLDPKALAAVFAQRPPAIPTPPASHPGAPGHVGPGPGPSSSQKMYAVTTPLSGYAPSAPQHPQYSSAPQPPQAPQAPQAPQTPPPRGAMGSGQYQRVPGSPQTIDPLSQQQPGVAPTPGQLPRPGATTQPLTGMAGANTEANSGMYGTIKMAPDVVNRLPPPPAPPAPPPAAAGTSSTSAIMRAPTYDPALDSFPGELSQRRRKRLIAMIVALSIAAVGLGIAVLYTVLSESSKQAAPVDSGAPVVTAAPTVGATATAAPTGVATASASAAPVAPPAQTVEAVTTPAVTAVPTTQPSVSATASAPARKPGPMPHPTSPTSTSKPGGIPDWLKHR